jgi:hypothetical protein
VLEVMSGAKFSVLRCDTALRTRWCCRNSEQHVTPYSTLKMEAVYYVETLVITYHATRSHTQ